MTREIASHLLESTCFAFVAWLLTLLLRRNQARVRFGVWLAASLKFLIPFAPLIEFGRYLDLFAPTSTTQLTIISAPVVQFDPATVVAPAPPPPHVDWISFALAAIWVAGMIAIAVVRFRAWLKVRSAMTSARPVDLIPGIDARVSPGLLEPGVVGFWKPVLLLPDGIETRLTPDQLASVVAHELSHIRRRDNIAAALHMVVETVSWFHPVVWWIGARLVAEREQACDEAVLNAGRDPREYADAILGVCRFYVESPLPCVAGVSGADIAKRIEVIMSNRKELALGLAKKAILALAGIAAIAGPVLSGLAIGVGVAPMIQAQLRTPGVPALVRRVLPQTVATQQTPARTPTPEVVTGQAFIPYSERKLIAMFFDLTGVTEDELSRARQAAVSFVDKNVTSPNVIAVMAFNGVGVEVRQDFTDDASQLRSAIAGLSPGTERPQSEFTGLQAAAKLLGSLPGKKSLYYFKHGTIFPGESLKSVMDTALLSNVAFFPIDMSAVGAQPPTVTEFGGKDLKIVVSTAREPVRLLISFDAVPGTYPITATVLGSDGVVKAELRDSVRVGPVDGAGRTVNYQGGFTLAAGTYSATVLVGDPNLNRVHGNVIHFTVPE